MWCDLNEAFGEGNNTFKKGWKQIMTNDDDSSHNSYLKNINNKSQNNSFFDKNEYMTHDHNFDKYSKIDNFANVHIQNNITPVDEDNINSNTLFQSNPYFSAQGDLHNQNNNITSSPSTNTLLSSSISSLPNNNVNNVNNIDNDIDNNIDNNIIDKKTKKKVQFDDNLNKENKYIHIINNHDHDYFIKTFLNILLNNDNKSSETNSDVYDHIKKCKYCREKIKQLLISHQNNNQSIQNINLNNPTNYNNQDNINNLDVYNNSEQEMYNSNGIELMILIIMGIIIMLIIDMIFKLE